MLLIVVPMFFLILLIFAILVCRSCSSTDSGNDTEIVSTHGSKRQKTRRPAPLDVEKSKEARQEFLWFNQCCKQIFIIKASTKICLYNYISTYIVKTKFVLNHFKLCDVLTRFQFHRKQYNYKSINICWNKLKIHKKTNNKLYEFIVKIS